MADEALTERQAEVLAAVRELCAGSQGPSLEEIGARVGLRGTVAVRRHLDLLTAKGYLRPRRYRKKRDIALTGRESAIAA
jgi:predicted ArsR family transcriptional regulator